MAFKYADRVHETTTSTGTGDLTLAGALDSTFQAFSAAFANGDTTEVAIYGAGAWEVCQATYNSGANSITRGELKSSSTGSRINFGAGTKNIIVSMPASLAVDKPQIREKLTSDRTYYVRSDGNDSNTGLANSSGGAFLTIQKAVDTLATIDFNGYGATISVGAGTFGAANFSAPLVGCSGVTISGAGSASTFITVSSNHGVIVQVPQKVTVTGVKITATTAGNGLFANGAGARIVIGSDVSFGACADASIIALNNGLIEGSSNFTIAGSTGRWLHAELGGLIVLAGLTVTFSGTPAWVTAGIYFTGGGAISMYAVTLSGAATGARYLGSLNATLNTFGAGTASTYFPGNSNGNLSSGAQQA